MPVTFVTHGNVGDQLCLISAARTYARLTCAEVYLEAMSDVVRLYGDGLLSAGCLGGRRDLRVCDLHRVKHSSPCKHYLGTFQSVLMPGREPSGFELPVMPPEPSRCLIQPYAVSVSNPDDRYLQQVVDKFLSTGEKLYAVGHSNTPRNLTGVDYSLCQDSVPALMGHIASAKMILTPRSASAHIAAAYKTPAFVWVPDDGENWHLDYPDWISKRTFTPLEDIDEWLFSFKLQ